MHADIPHRLDAIERRHRLAVFGLGAVCLLLAGACIALWLRPPATELPDHVRLRELVVVDPAGIERVRISGDLPDAVIDGKRVDRGSAAAGVMLYDRSGQERGGYVTWDEGDNIGLTLDGRERQSALFVAGPDGTAALQIWHGGRMLDLRADADGARLSQSVDGRVQLQLPEVAALSASTCTLFRGGLADEVPGGLPPAQVRGICTSRFSEAACSACLGSDDTAQ
ncbi:hypothetical protein MNO14_06990 [Luteimonas sp. S4-F44]|uniref:hypothetical protein n=1 Tax=Luteimonas sp. S4-F44 TaxID=2925842 RepID=UPI001F52FEF8|nr:hypothetical protein [Luteimonas sp. S4-F44]UNK43792.1 hypothetical protein MNO14_06990 [Luteimonas sp. S4-F44]